MAVYRKMAKHVFFVSLFALFMHGVSDVYQVSVSLISGDSVTLHTGVETHQQERIRWYFNNIRIAQISGDLSKTCTDVQCQDSDERFRHRLKLDQTGSLTITNIRTTDAGLYILQIKNNNNISEKSFIVAVHSLSDAGGHGIKTESAKKGESVTLYPAAINYPNDVMTWYFNNTHIAEITGDQSKICADDQCKERFRDRLKLDQTGSLTITDTRNTDSGLYQLKINSSRYIILKTFGFNVTDSHSETSALHQTSGGFITISIVIILALLAVASAGGVIYWFVCLKATPKGQKYGVEIVLKVVGQSVILNTDTEVQTDDHIKWMFGDQKSLIAQIKHGTREFTIYKDDDDDDDDEKFIDRLELNHQTGSLTIRNSRTTDSGLYHLQIDRSGKTSFKRFSVTVSESPETRLIMLYPSEITETKIPLIEKHPTTSV